MICLRLNEIRKNHREVFESLREAGVSVNLHYIPVYRQPYYERLGFRAGYCPVAEQYYTEAIARWKQVIDGYRFSPLRAPAYLKTGQTRFGLGQFDQAIAAYQSLSANYPNTPEAQEAQFQIIQCYYNKGDLRGA